MLMKGELEVYQGSPPTRLGFLAEGSFFGESAILDSSGSDIRTRTVVAVSDCELCFITRDDIQMIGSMYPELEARLRRFKTIGKRRLNTKGLKQVDREALKEYASTFKEMRAEVQRHEHRKRLEYQLVSHHDIAAIRVAFFSRCQRYRADRARRATRASWTRTSSLDRSSMA